MGTRDCRATLPSLLSKFQAMATWYIFTHGVFSPMASWEHEALDKALAQHRDSLEYVWPLAGAKPNGETTHTRYEMDIRAVTQTNTSTKMVRPMLYLPDDKAHSVTSPFHA